MRRLALVGLYRGLQLVELGGIALAVAGATVADTANALGRRLTRYEPPPPPHH